ncbi:hypothetical protein [Tunturiibacter lichenicola]|uniref:hypothetical protein n=1 Tax=Tunturiibacter lichenicola TaxID=2051959 RepID=UPI003D9ADDD2
MEGRIYSCDLISGRLEGAARASLLRSRFCWCAAAGSGGGLLGESADVVGVLEFVAEDEVVAGGDDERFALCANNSHLRIENGHAANLVLSYEKSNSFNIYSPAMTAYLG